MIGMLRHKIGQCWKALRWQREVRQAVSTQLALLENPSIFAMGGLTDEEEARLAALVRRAAAHDGPIVELGTLFGLTTLLIAAAARPGQRVIAIDNFCWNPFGLPPDLHEAFTRKVLRNELAAGRVELARAASADVRREWSGPPPAIVFLDADHSYTAVRDEIAWAKALGVPIICGHDYGNARFGATRAVDEAFGGDVEVHGMVWSWERPA
jgi:hypothetical protein